MIDAAQVRTPPPTRGQSVRSSSKKPNLGTGMASMEQSNTTANMTTPWMQQQGLPTSFSQPNLSLHSGTRFGTFPDMNADMHFDSQGASFSDRYMAQLLSQGQHQNQMQSGNVFGGPLPVQPFPYTIQFDSATGRPLGQNLNNNSNSSSALLPERQPFTDACDADPVGPWHPMSKPLSGSVNPSLVYTSPGRAMQDSLQNARRPATRPQANVKGPMHLQAARPMTTGQQVPSHQRTGTEVYTSLDSARPGLRRSNTTGAASRSSSRDSLTRSNSGANLSRRASPLKSFIRNSVNPLSSIAETTKNLPRSRTSVVLTIDPDGRARAETRSIDQSPTKSLKARYPTLYDGSDSESDSDVSSQSRRIEADEQLLTTSRASSAQARTPRYDLSSSEEGLHLPRSNSTASMRATPTKSSYSTGTHLRRTGSVKKPTHQTSREKRNSMASLTGSLAELPVSLEGHRSEAMENSDAGTALRKAMEQRNARQDPGGRSI